MYIDVYRCITTHDIVHNQLEIVWMCLQQGSKMGDTVKWRSNDEGNDKRFILGVPLFYITIQTGMPSIMPPYFQNGKFKLNNDIYINLKWIVQHRV